MNRVFFIFLIILHSQVIFAQFTDDFSGRDFTDSPGWKGDSSKVVKTILNNEMIGNSGNTTWGETSEEGLQLNTGMYIVWMEVFSDNRDGKRFKEVIVLSR